MLPDPVDFEVARNLQTALKAIKKADDYYYTVAGTAVKLDPNHKAEDLIPGADQPIGPARPFVLLDLSAPSVLDFPSRSNQVRITQPFSIAWVNDSDPTDDDSLLLTFFRGLHDVEKAIVVDVQRGGLVYDTLIGSREMRQQGREVWAIVSGIIKRERTYGVPNG